MPFRLTRTQSRPFAPRSLVTGIARFCGAANGGGFRGRGCDGWTRAGSRELLSHTLGLSSVLMLEPEVRAQCGSAARWDLCGGRLEPTGERPSLPRPRSVVGARPETGSATHAGTGGPFAKEYTRMPDRRRAGSAAWRVRRADALLTA